MQQDKPQGFRSRKFVLAAFLAVAGIPLLIFGYLSDVQFVLYEIGIAGAYITGNVLDK